MTVPAAPLPSTGSLLRAIRTPFDFRNPLWADATRRLYLFGSGRAALAKGLDALRRERGADRVRVWWPGYICAEAMAGLHSVPTSFEFYRVRSDLTPEWETVGPVPSDPRELQVLVLVHYFGFPNDTNGARTFADANEMLLLEDGAHLIGMTPGMGVGDMLFFSPWKLLPVPSGGILAAKPEVAHHLEAAARGDVVGTLGWLVVRLIQRVLRRLHIPWHGLLRFPFLRRSVESGITPGGAGRVGRYVARLLQEGSQEAERVRRSRRGNYLALLDGIRDAPGIRPLFPELPDSVCPYMFPIVLETPSGPVVSRLESIGIPASEWPELPEAIGDDPILHRQVLDLRDHLLLLPLHQDLSKVDIDDIASKVRDSVAG